MSTISATFTDVGVSNGLLVEDGQSADYELSGMAFDGTFAIERTNDNGQTWETVTSTTTPDDTFSGTVTVPGTYRWNCTVFNSGSADASIESSVVTLFGPIRNAAGEVMFEVTSEGIQTAGSVTADNVAAARRVVALPDAATVTANADTTDLASVAALSQTTTFANPSGTPTDGQLLEFRVTTASGGQTVSFGNKFQATAIALPTATTGSAAVDRWLFEWNAGTSKWAMLAVTAGA